LLLGSGGTGESTTRGVKLLVVAIYVAAAGLHGRTGSDLLMNWTHTARRRLCLGSSCSRYGFSQTGGPLRSSAAVASASLSK